MFVALVLIWLIALASALPRKLKSDSLNVTKSILPPLQLVLQNSVNAACRSRSLLLGTRTRNTTVLTALLAWPPELRTSIVFDFTDTRPNMIDVYCNVIEALFRISLQPRNSELDPYDFEMINTHHILYAIRPLILGAVRNNYMFQATIQFLIAVRISGCYSGYSKLSVKSRVIALIIMGAVPRVLHDSTPTFVDSEISHAGISQNSNVTSFQLAAPSFLLIPGI